MKKRYLWLIILFLLLVGCGNTDMPNGDGASQADVLQPETTSPDDYALDVANYTHAFVTTARIHEDMPEFTFIRIVNDRYVNNYSDFPMAVEVRIEIKDGEGSTIQVISGLSQSIHGGNTREITFNDYNFDGFLDMRLTRWQDGAGGLLLNEYFWLWDNYSFQFVLNEELMNIGRAADIFAHQELRQVMIWQRIAAMGVGIHFEWHDEKLVAVGYYTTLRPYDYQYFWDWLEATLNYYGLELEHVEDDYIILGERSYATGWAAPFDEGYILVEVGFNADGLPDSIAFDARGVVLTDYFSYEEIRAFAYKIMDYPGIDWNDLTTIFDELFGSDGHNAGILHTAFMRAGGEPRTNMPTITHFTFFR